MESTTPATLHAPAARLDRDQVLQQARQMNSYYNADPGLDAARLSIMVLNIQRQLVFVNSFFVDLLGTETLDEILAQRPGEAMKCIHARDNPAGCGTSEACRYCSLVNLVLAAMKDKETHSGEGVITRDTEGYPQALNLMVTVAPIDVDREHFYLVILQDIGDKIRRRLLEQVFFHDVLNTSGGLIGLLSLLKDEVPDSLRPEVEFIETAGWSLIEQIREQKRLIEAESGDLKITWQELNSREILLAIAGMYKNHAVARHKRIVINSESETVAFWSEAALLRSVLGNMLKNALEATEPEAEVSLGCRRSAEGAFPVEFWVHNPGYMERAVQMQIFQRSFSTKGDGRGLGTYSMKLLGERYLQGQVDFTTDPETGTTFYLRLPARNLE